MIILKGGYQMTTVFDFEVNTTQLSKKLGELQKMLAESNFKDKEKAKEIKKLCDECCYLSFTVDNMGYWITYGIDKLGQRDYIDDLLEGVTDDDDDE